MSFRVTLVEGRGMTGRYLLEVLSEGPDGPQYKEVGRLTYPDLSAYVSRRILDVHKADSGQQTE